LRFIRCLIATALLASCARAPEPEPAQGNDIGAPQRASGGAAEQSVPAVAGDQASPRAAAEVVRTYFRRIAEGQDADHLWFEGSAGAAELTGLLSGLTELRAEVGAPGAMEGTAGSSFIEVPASIEARRPDRARFSRDARFTLRRVNNVPGATAEQLRWRIHSVALGEDRTLP